MALKRTSLSVLFVCTAAAVSSSYAVQDDFSEFKKKYQNKYKEHKSDYTERYETYKKELIEKWGVVELSSDTEYVAYSDDKSVKVIADFEHDTIEVNIQPDVQAKITPEDEEQMVKDAIIQALNVAPKTAANQNVEFAITSTKNVPTVLPAKSEKSDEKDTLLTHLGIKDETALKTVLSKVKAVLSTSPLMRQC